MFTSIQQSTSGTHALTNRSRWCALLAVSTLFIVYGSLFPFHFVARNLIEISNFFLEWIWEDRISLGDLLGNIALFVPFGLTGVLALNPPFGRIAASFAVVAAAIILAVVLQVLQIFLPERMPSINDVVWNGIGAVGGICVGWLINKWSRKPVSFSVFTIPIGLITLWLASELIPFIPTLDVQLIKDNLKPIFYTQDISISKTLNHAIGVLLAGYFLMAVWDARRAYFWLGGLLLVVFAAKIVIIMQQIDLSVMIGFTVGYIIFISLALLPRHRSNLIAFWCVLLMYSLASLVPFDLRDSIAPFNWIPFIYFLENDSLLSNTQSILERLTIFFGLLWLVHGVGGRLMPTSIALTFWVGLLEMIQMVVATRTPDITDLILMMSAGWILSYAVEMEFRQHTDQHRGANPLFPHIEAQSRYQYSSARSQVQIPVSTKNISHAVLGIVVASLGLAILMLFILRAPQLPYNVKELFLGNGAFPFLVGFALALLWQGVAPAWIAQRVIASRYPYLILPSAVFFASTVTLLLLYTSVTEESISDISGSNNLYWWVVNRQIWGEWATHLFVWMNTPEWVAFFERPVRFAALHGPLVLFPALILTIVDGRWVKNTLSGECTLKIMIIAILYLWLCKAIAFDWSSTDNLNELIAPDGFFGLGGGSYLYFLLTLLAINVVVFARVRLTPIGLIVAITLTLVWVWLGWLLLNLGLNQQVYKYDWVFSGVQFLLGPDREHILDQQALFLRWAIVQLGVIVVLSIGMRIAGLALSDRSNDPLAKVLPS